MNMRPVHAFALVVSAALAALAMPLVAGSAQAAARTVQCRGEGASGGMVVDIFAGLLFDRRGRLRQPFPARGAGQATIRISGEGRNAQRLRGDIEIVSAAPPAFDLRVPAERGPRTIAGAVTPGAASFALALDGPDVAFRGVCGPRPSRR